MANTKKWHPLSNGMEHKQFVKALNKGFGRCVLCNRAVPLKELSESYVEGDSGKKYCGSCFWTFRDYKHGFISEKRYLEAIEESKKSGIKFEMDSYY